MYYTIGLCFCLCIYYYYYIEDILFYLSNVLNEYLIIKDFQDIITIYLQITFLLAIILSLIYFYFVYFLWNKVITYNTEKKTYQIFLGVYLGLTVFWIVKQDLFFSNWEVFLLSTKTWLFDIQPDFYIFFQNLIEDLYDFFIISSILYVYYFMFLNKKKHTKFTAINQTRILFFLFFLIYFIYFFSCESWLNFIFFNIISLFITEFLLYTKYMLIELKKLIIKSKYF